MSLAALEHTHSIRCPFPWALSIDAMSRVRGTRLEVVTRPGFPTSPALAVCTRLWMPAWPKWQVVLLEGGASWAFGLNVHGQLGELQSPLSMSLLTAIQQLTRQLSGGPGRELVAGRVWEIDRPRVRVSSVQGSAP